MVSVIDLFGVSAEKRKNVNETSHYKPAKLLSAFSIIVERDLCSRLMDFAIDNNLFASAIHGYSVNLPKGQYSNRYLLFWMNSSIPKRW